MALKYALHITTVYILSQNITNRSVTIRQQICSCSLHNTVIWYWYESEKISILVLLICVQFMET